MKTSQLTARVLSAAGPIAPAAAPATSRRLLLGAIHPAAATRAFLFLALQAVASAQSAAPALVSTKPASVDWAGAPGLRAEAPWAQAEDWYWHRDTGDNLQKSTARFLEFLAGRPDDAQVLWRLGRNSEREGERQASRRDKLKRFEEAENTLRRAVSLDPGEPEAHYWLGVTMGRIGETRGILKSLFLVGPIRGEMRRTLELNPKHGGAHRVLGEMLRQIPRFAGGSKKGAVSELETAVQAEPDMTSHYAALAQAYLDAGERDKAKAALLRFFEVKTPKDPGAFEEDRQDVLAFMKRLGMTPPR